MCDTETMFAVRQQIFYIFYAKIILCSWYKIQWMEILPYESYKTIQQNQDLNTIIVEIL